MRPQAGCGGGTPTPRKDSDASVDDHHAEHQRRQHDRRVHHVRQDVPPHDRPFRTARDDGEADELAFLQRQHLAAHHACVACPVDQAQDDDDVPHARADDGGEEDGEGQCRQREPGVGDAHDDLVRPAAEIAREDAQHGADHAGEDHRGEADDHRDPGAEDQPRQHVASELVGAEQVLGGAARLPERRMKARGQRADLGIMRCQDVGEDRHERDDAQDDDRDQRNVAQADRGRAWRHRRREDNGFYRCAHVRHFSRRMRGSITA